MKTRIAILSDTHSCLRPEVKEIIKTCQCIIHAGDIGSESLLDELRWMGNIYAVRGNCDGTWAAGMAQKLRFAIGGVKFFVVHDRKQADWNLGDTQVVIFGHSHKYFQENIDGRMWFNPGSCGVRRFGNELTMAVITVENGGYTVEKVLISPGE